jgi:hypothetical protein
MDKVDNSRYSRVFCALDGVPPDIRICRTITRFLNRIPRNPTSPIRQHVLLRLHRSNPSDVSYPGFRMEIVTPLISIPNKSARRMYYPKQYHYVQEIQKFNVADYRPR